MRRMCCARLSAVAECVTVIAVDGLKVVTHEWGNVHAWSKKGALANEVGVVELISEQGLGAREDRKVTADGSKKGGLGRERGLELPGWMQECVRGLMILGMVLVLKWLQMRSLGWGL